MELPEYNFNEFGPGWRKTWDKENHKCNDDDPRPKYYCLDMFPYPSGAGLHVGHWRGYVLSDVWTRYKILSGFNVLHPMGWDAFGLPAENDAIKRGIHPQKLTAMNIENIKRQIKEIGAYYDWGREINTSGPEYYKWTQWIFLKMYEKGLAYRTEMPINWCPSCKTGLANEEVIGGTCERCGSDVTKKNLMQWMLKITAYAERLLNDLEKLDWPEKVKIMQANWIGRSEGAEVIFKTETVSKESVDIPIYTTRPDTLFGATYMVLAPEHPLVDKFTTDGERSKVEAYMDQAKRKSSRERIAEAGEKSGVFIGSTAVNPVNNEQIPIWISDYVLMEYGTGAIMAVPAHDQRDFEFATEFGLPIVEVISPPEGGGGKLTEAYINPGTMVNSAQFDGMPSEEGKNIRLPQWLAEKGLAEAKVNYRLRDWVYSRQRYWGEPIPIVYCDNCGEVPVPESDLPVVLPYVEKYEPTGTGRSPLSAIDEFVNTTCPKCGGPAKRETDTMPQWAGSSWYFLRYPSPDCDSSLCDKDAVKAWLPVDMYVGGIEHAILHLLYARFFTKFLYDIDVIDFDEPFTRLFNQGMICKKSEITGKLEKMSKSKGNVVSPDELIQEYGSDTVRLYELFVGPPELESEWEDAGIEGIFRFLKRVWRYVLSNSTGEELADKTSEEMEKKLHYTIKVVEEKLEKFQFNTLVSKLMEYVNYLYSTSDKPDRKTIETLLIILSPMAPHIAEELWHRLGYDESIFKSTWPKYDENLAKIETVTIVVQVNGKVRDKFDTDVDISKEEMIKTAKELPGLTKYLEGKNIIKTIPVPGRLVNFVVK